MNQSVTTDHQPLHCSYPWNPDQGDGTYRNPVICADYSDMDIVRVGCDYYMTASSFNCTPALPILHSNDLVNWTLINHALKNLPHPRYQAVQPGCGVWAPTIRYHDERFWIFFPMPDEGIYVIHTDSPRSPQWSKPHLLLAGKGYIDPCPLWDDDGKAYLAYAYAKSRCGIDSRLDIRPMSPDAMQLLGEGRKVYENPQRHHTLEGPKCHKRNGCYYISAPAGGVGDGWQVILRSRNIYGPYEDKIVLAQGTTSVNGPHQGALIDSPDGQEWWFMHFQDAGLIGRIAHLQPVTWENDWPMIGTNQDNNGVGEPVLRNAKPAKTIQCQATQPATSDDFSSDQLGLQWQWYANHQAHWYSLTACPDQLRLYAQPRCKHLHLTPNLLLQKFPAHAFTVTTHIKLSAANQGDEAGLVIVGYEQTAALMLCKIDHAYHLQLIVNDTLTDTVKLKSDALILQADIHGSGLCTLSYHHSALMDRHTIGEHFKAAPGKWIGAKIGLLCRGSHDAHADIASFNFSTLI